MKPDSFSFLTLITKLQWLVHFRVVHVGSSRRQSMDRIPITVLSTTLPAFLLAPPPFLELRKIEALLPHTARLSNP